MATPRYEKFPHDIVADIGDPWDVFADTYVIFDAHLVEIDPEVLVANFQVGDDILPLAPVKARHQISITVYDEEGHAIGIREVDPLSIPLFFRDQLLHVMTQKPLPTKQILYVNVEQKWQEAGADLSHRSSKKLGLKFQNP